MLFEELAPLYANLMKEVADLRSEDIAVVVGTRGEVVRIGFMLAAKQCKKVLVNLHSSAALPPEFFHTTILGHASEEMARVEELVRSHLGPPTPSSDPKMSG